MKNNAENTAVAIMAVKALPRHDTLRPVFDPVPRAQVEDTDNSHTDVVVIERGGQYDGIAIPIDIVAWKNYTDKKLEEFALTQQQLASLQQAYDSMQQENASMRQAHDSLQQAHDTMQQENASMQGRLASIQLQLDIALECPVCLDSQRDMRLHCGHLVCRNCVEQVTICPTCREPVGTSPPRHVYH